MRERGVEAVCKCAFAALLLFATCSQVMQQHAPPHHASYDMRTAGYQVMTCGVGREREREREGVGVVSDWRAGERERERERERVPLVEEKVRRRGDDDMMHRLECSP